MVANTYHLYFCYQGYAMAAENNLYKYYHLVYNQFCTWYIATHWSWLFQKYDAHNRASKNVHLLFMAIESLKPSYVTRNAIMNSRWMITGVLLIFVSAVINLREWIAAYRLG